ncbi:MAG TPA: NAD(P)H-dependent oxidoreductase subunit E [Thermoanaerobaculia bacterium]|nr:NAD(P)H-dependent oxidoreductase subunit E [Thermoanaerobaculia bacterium]
MDLHIVGGEPTEAERAAVDELLGAPESGWDGGEREADRDGRSARGGHAARGRRDLLLPALHAVQDRIGWISRGALNHICRRLTVPPAEAWGVLTFYHLFATEPRPPVVAHVCDDIACRARGAEGLCHRLEQTLGPAGASLAGGRSTWVRSPCLGQCERAPAVMVVRAGEVPSAEVLAPVADTAEIAAALAGHPRGEPTGSRLEAVRRSVPQAGSLGLQLLARAGTVDPESLDAYRAAGGYRALARAFELGPAGVVAEVIAAKLVGRGGAAFPTGRKWEAVAKANVHPRYLIVNADESEPGTFKDRVLLEEDPFAILEAMAIAAFATGCERGFIYLRGEYPLAHERLSRAIAAARAAGLLGADVAGAGFAFDLEIRRGAGAYICGEETALFNSIEGKRGEPRSKPPFPTQAGLFGKPTVVNNVETLANVPGILLAGGAAWAGIGTEGSSGTKLFCVSGHVEKPGLYELPFGATLGELIELAGGVAAGRALKAVLLGGAAGAFVGPEALGVPLTFEGARAAGATLGSGVVLVYDETADLADALVRIAEFFRHESCGQCVPCRVGTMRQLELLERLRHGRQLGSVGEELALLRELGQAMRDASICGLGQTASSAIESAMARLDPFQLGGSA